MMNNTGTVPPTIMNIIENVSIGIPTERENVFKKRTTSVTLVDQKGLKVLDFKG